MQGQNAGDQWPPSHLFASYGLPRVVSELSDSQECIYRYLCGPGKLASRSVFGQQGINSGLFLTRPSRRGGLLYTIP